MSGMEGRLRRYVPANDDSGMLPLEAADHIRDLEQDLTSVRADRDRLATKLRNINQLLEPQAWAEGSRNRTLLMAAIHDTPQRTNA